MTSSKLVVELILHVLLDSLLRTVKAHYGHCSISSDERGCMYLISKKDLKFCAAPGELNEQLCIFSSNYVTYCMLCSLKLGLIYIGRNKGHYRISII